MSTYLGKSVMGGYGSNRWGNYEKRRLADTALTLVSHEVVKGLPKEAMTEPCASNGFARRWWTNGKGEQIASINSAFANVTGSSPAMILRFYSGGVEQQQLIHFTGQPRHYGGFQWFFECPRCARRVVKIYLPIGGALFLCRDCHDLTYDSCQTSHQFAGLGRLGKHYDVLIRAQKIEARMKKYRIGSKRWHQAARRLDAILDELRSANNEV